MGAAAHRQLPMQSLPNPREHPATAEQKDLQIILSSGDDYLVYLLDVPWFGELFDFLLF